MTHHDLLEVPVTLVFYLAWKLAGQQTCICLQCSLEQNVFHFRIGWDFGPSSDTQDCVPRKSGCREQPTNPPVVPTNRLGCCTNWHLAHTTRCQCFLLLFFWILGDFSRDLLTVGQELLSRHWAALAPQLGFGPKDLRVTWKNRGWLCFWGSRGVVNS